MFRGSRLLGLHAPGMSEMARSGRNLLVDGYMHEATAGAYTGSAGATLSKQDGSPLVGQCLRVATASASVYAYQAVLVPGQRFTLRGWARGDGGDIPLAWDNANVFNGASSTTWQRINVTWVAVQSQLRLYCYANVGAGYVEFKDLMLF